MTNKFMDYSTYRAPQTNADRIRAMSDEELAEFIPVMFDCCCNPTEECMREQTNRGECLKTKDCVLRWLKSEVKEENKEWES